MNKNFSILTDCIIKRSEGMIDVNDGVSKNCFYRIYPFTTENISGYINLFDLKDKSLLTVGSSCDQVINSILMGCRDVTLLDINPYTKFYFYLKMACILELSRDEFIKFLRFRDYPDVFKDNKEVFNIDVYNKIKLTLRLIDYESYLIWDELFQSFKPLDIRENLFSSDEGRDSEVIGSNLYLQSDILYEQTRDKIKKVIPDFINEDLFKINFNKEFDNIWLSNIGTLLSIDKIKMITDKFSKFLKQDGSLLISYLYDTTKDTKYQNDWSEIYNLKKVFKALEEYSLSLETFVGEKSLKFGTDNIKDSVLIYRKR